MSKIIEYQNYKDELVSLSLEEAEAEWKVKIIKKTKGAQISDYCGKEQSIIVPAYIDGFPVKRVDRISKTPETIKEVVLPPTVETLTNKTFNKCANLCKLTISTDTEVPVGAFDKCTDLGDDNNCVVVGGVLHLLTLSKGKVVISDGVRVIPDGFQNDTGGWSSSTWGPISARGKITSILFPESLETIGKDAFCGQKRLSRLEFPRNLRVIDDGAFSFNPSLKKIVFNEGLEKLHGFKWFDTGSPLNITVPDSVVDFNAFGNTSITDIELPAGIKQIPSLCFKGCDKLTEIIIPDGVKTIGWLAFSGCKQLENVYIPDSVENIDGRAFEECYKARFHYNKHNMSFRSDAFIDCDQLTDEKGCQVFNGVLIKYKGTEEAVELPGSIEKICNCSFKNNKRIKSIVFDNPNILLGEDDNTEAFRGCFELADENGFVIVNNCLFDYFGINREVKVPDNVEFIASGCFTADKVSKVYIPSSVKNIGSNAFDKEVDIEFSTSVPFIKNQWILVGEYEYIRNDDDNGSSIGINRSSVNTLEWKQEQMPDGFFCIGDCLVYCDKTDSQLELPQGIKSIASQALGGINGINADREAIYVPEGVEYIAPDAFGKTKRIYLPETIKAIENLPKEDVTVFIHEGIDFENVLIDKSGSNYTVKIIGKDAAAEDELPVFIVGRMKSGGVRIKAYNGPAGKDVDLIIPSHIDGMPVESIGKEVFKGKSFRRIELPDTVETIESDAFCYAEFDFIKLSSNLKKLETGAFEYHRFSYIDLPETLVLIKMAALSARVAVFHGDPKVTDNNLIDTYYADGENVKKHVGRITAGHTELRSIAELDEKYSEYRNCGVVVRGADGRVKDI